MYEEKRDELKEEMKEIDECGMEEFVKLDSSEETIAILGDKWWTQAAKQEGDLIRKKNLCYIWKQRNGHPHVGGVFIRSRNGAPSRKGCVANYQMTKASNKFVRPPADPYWLMAPARLNKPCPPDTPFVAFADPSE